MTDSVRKQVTHYIVAHHAPDLANEEIPDDYDLVDTGVVDSLALLELIEWLQSRFGISVLDVDISPRDFRSIGSITRFVSSNQLSNTTS